MTTNKEEKIEEIIIFSNQIVCQSLSKAFPFHIRNTVKVIVPLQ